MFDLVLDRETAQPPNQACRRVQRLREQGQRMAATVPVHADQHEGPGSRATVLRAQRVAVESEGDRSEFVSTQAKSIATAAQKLPQQGFALAQQLSVSRAGATADSQRRQSGRHTAPRHRRPMSERRLPVPVWGHCKPSWPASPRRLAAPQLDGSASIRWSQRL